MAKTKMANRKFIHTRMFYIFIHTRIFSCVTITEMSVILLNKINKAKC